MKILYISQWFSSVGGGGEVVFQDLAKCMSMRGHDVQVMCARTKTSNKQFEHVHEHRIKPLLDVPPPTVTQNVVYFTNGLINGYRLVRIQKVQLIHANNLVSAIIGIVLSKVFRLPLVVTIHDVFTTNSQNHWKEWTEQEKKISKITSIIAPVLEKLTVKLGSDVIHTVSNATKEDLIKFGSTSRIKVIPNGINLNDYNASNSITYDNYIVFIGRLVFYKNLEVIISAFKEVVKNLHDSKTHYHRGRPHEKKMGKKSKQSWVTG